MVRFPAIPIVAAPFSVKVPLMVTSFPNERVDAADSLNVPPVAIVNAPVKVFVPVADEIARMPLAPAPTVVVPLTVNVKPAAVKVVAFPTARLPLIVNPATVVVVAVPLNVRLPPIAVVPVDRVFAPDPERVRLE